MCRLGLLELMRGDCVSAVRDFVFFFHQTAQVFIRIGGYWGSLREDLFFSFKCGGLWLFRLCPKRRSDIAELARHFPA